MNIYIKYFDSIQLLIKHSYIRKGSEWGFILNKCFIITDINKKITYLFN